MFVFVLCSFHIARLTRVTLCSWPAWNLLIDCPRDEDQPSAAWHSGDAVCPNNWLQIPNPGVPDHSESHHPQLEPRPPGAVGFAGVTVCASPKTCSDDRTNGHASS